MATTPVPVTTTFDQTKAIFMDAQDCRASGWPCQGRHIPGQKRSNAAGQWQECGCCGIRTLYVPKHGFKAKTVAVVNYGLVSKAMTMLEGILQNSKPTSTIVQMAIECVKAEEMKQKAMSELQVGILKALQHGGDLMEVTEEGADVKSQISSALEAMMAAPEANSVPPPVAFDGA
eukprot:s1867_g10.t1